MRVRWPLALLVATLVSAPLAFAQETKPDVAGLIVSLKDGDPAVRASSARILGELGPTSKEAVPALIEALKDESTEVRRNAAKSLGQIGPAAKQAVPAICETLNDANWELRRNAVTALGAIGDRAAEPTLKKAKNDPNDKVRAAAKRALKGLKKT